VVLLHGCAGMRASSGAMMARDDDWGARLAALGYAVLHLDSLSPRGERRSVGAGDGHDLAGDDPQVDAGQRDARAMAHAEAEAPAQRRTKTPSRGGASPACPARRPGGGMTSRLARRPTRHPLGGGMAAHGPS